MKITITLLASALSSAAAAVSPGAATRDPRAVVPLLRNESALRGYAANQDVPLARWRETKGNVGALDGHAGHLTSANPAQLPRAEPGEKQ